MTNQQIVQEMQRRGYTLVPDLNNEPATDFILSEGAGVWIGIKNLQLHIKAGDEGVSVEILPCPGADEPSITETWATWKEGGRSVE